MKLRLILYGCIFSISALQAQHAVSDTISYNDWLLKSTGGSVIETTADTSLTLVVNELMAVNSDLVFDEAGDDDDWFEIFNYGDLPIALNNLGFSDDATFPCRWKFQPGEEVIIDPGGYYLFWADGEPEEGENHASFRLSGEGEFLGIYDSECVLIDAIYFGSQTANISYGRVPDGGLGWGYFEDPTPNGRNDTAAGENLLPLPVASSKGGFYPTPVLLELSSSVPGSIIRYTTDCSEPDDSSQIYNGPFQIYISTVIRARIFKEDEIDGPILTLSYFIEENLYENPVISLVSDPDKLYGESGLFENVSSEIEIPANFEFILDGEAVYTSGAGVQLHAPKSTLPYSMRLYSRTRYGNSWFEFPFFENQSIPVYKRLILRNSGNDCVSRNVLNTHFRDPLIHAIAKQSNISPQVSASQPVNVLLNGNYLGMMNLRERIDRYYVESHYGISDNFDLIERAFGYPGNRNVIVGTRDHWFSVLAFADTTGDLSTDEDYLAIQEMIDLTNFTDYWITEVYVGNYDWLSNNIKFWRPEGGKWNWIYWDLDHGLGMKYFDYGYPEWNTLQWSLTFSDRAWPTGQNNRVIRNLLKNDDYKELFIRRFTELLNTSFRFERTELLLDSIKNIYTEDIKFHTSKYPGTYSDWVSACEGVRHYLEERPGQVFQHLTEFFELEEPVEMEIHVDPPMAGKVFFGNKSVTSTSFTATCFPGIEYILKAEAQSGYIFAGWSDPVYNEEELNITLSEPHEVTAAFAVIGSFEPLQINELYFHNKENYDCGDWIEIYNMGIEDINLSGHYLTGSDEKEIYTFENGTIIQSMSYLIIAEDTPGCLGWSVPIRQKTIFHRSSKDCKECAQSRNC